MQAKIRAMKRLPFWICLLLLPLHGFSQIEDAWVHFTDKPNVSVALANPETILTLRAIQRKSQQGVPIDERDVPVNSLYVDQIEASSGITVLAQSKWFNNVHVRGTQADITALLALSFVDEITFANKGLGTIRTPYQYQDKFEMEASSVIFDYGSATTQVEMINIHQVHQMDYTGDGVLVAVMDSGFPGVNIMAGFQRLRDAGDLLGGYDFVDRTADIYAYTANSHGTWVLSTMGGYIENSYVGVAPDASYLLYRTEDAGSENPVEESYWVQAAERADSLGVDIVNTSLGYKSYDNSSYSHTSSDMDGTTTYITRGANIAVEKGMLLVNSAGNSGINGVNAPADSPSVVSVGAVQSNETYASFSSQGNGIQPSIKPDVAAMGVSTAVIDPSGSVVGLNGTSFSGPIIAGALACIKQASPSSGFLEIFWE